MKDQSLPKRLLFLFGYFARIGCFTFGGGWSIIAQMQTDFVEKRGWLTDEELVDMTSIGRSLPGVMIGNVTFMFGYRIAGVPGGLVSVLGLNLAPFIVLAFITQFYVQFRSNIYVGKVLSGIRAAVLPIMFSAAYKLRKSALKDWIGWVILLIAFLLSTFTGFSRVLTVVLAAIGGVMIKEVLSRGTH